MKIYRLSKYPYLFLKLCSRIAISHPRKVILFYSLLAMLSCLYAFHNLRLTTDQEQMISESLPHHAYYQRFLRNFQDTDFIYTIVELENHPPERIIQFIETFTNKLKSVDGLEEIISKIEINKENLLFLIPENRFNTYFNLFKLVKKNIHSKAKKNRFSNINQFVNSIQRNLKQSKQSPQEAVLSLLMLQLLSDAMIKQLNHQDYKSLSTKVDTYLNKPKIDLNYLRSTSNKLLFIMLLPKKDFTTINFIEQPLQQIRQVLKETKKLFPGINAGTTGRSVFQSDQINITQWDMSIASILSILGVSLLFCIFIRSVNRSLTIIFTLCLSIIITLGFTTLAIGSLNILTIVFGIILISLGISFGIHILSRYYEELKKSETRVKNSICNAIIKTGKSNLTAGFTSAFAFYSAYFINFKGITELGIIAGTGLLITLLMMLTFLPALVFLFDENRSVKELQKIQLAKLTFLSRILEYPKLIVLILSGPFVFFVILLFFQRPGFNNNIMTIQANNVESVQYERKLIEHNSTSWFIIRIVKNKQEQVEVINKLKKLKSISHTDTIQDFISEKKSKQINEMLQYLQKTSPIKEILRLNVNRLPSFVPVIGLKESLRHIRNHLKSPSFQLGSNLPLSSSKKEMIRQMKQDLIQQLDILIEKLSTIPIKKTGNTIAILQKQFFSDIQQMNELLNKTANSFYKDDLIETLPSFIQSRFLEVSPPKQITQDKLNNELMYNLDDTTKQKTLKSCYTTWKENQSFEKSYFLKNNISESQKKECSNLIKESGYPKHSLIYIYPKLDIWQGDNLSKFVTDVENAIAPITGPIVSLHKNIKILQHDLLFASLGIFLFVFVTVWFDFVSIRHTFLTLLPVSLGLVWLFGIMSLTELLSDYVTPLQFNLSNFFSIPIIIGSGVDYGLHIIQRFRDTSHRFEKAYKEVTQRTLVSISFSCWTTVIGFATLLLSQHQGLKSLGLIILIGNSMCWLHATLLLPVIFKYIHQKKQLSMIKIKG